MTALLLVAAGVARALTAADTPAAEPPPPAEQQQPADSADSQQEATPGSEQPNLDNLDFDLLGAPEPPPLQVEEGSLATRRIMLTLHQGFGIALVALMAGTMITGQLNYSDRFDGPASGRFELAHKVFAFSTAGTFAVTGALAFLAPVPIEKQSEGIDRVTLHWAGMLGATAGMVAEVILGLVSVGLEGHVAQADVARAHLAIGYTTLAFMTGSLAALVF